MTHRGFSLQTDVPIEHRNIEQRTRNDEVDLIGKSQGGSVPVTRQQMRRSNKFLRGACLRHHTYPGSRPRLFIFCPSAPSAQGAMKKEFAFIRTVILSGRWDGMSSEGSVAGSGT